MKTKTKDQLYLLLILTIIASLWLYSASISLAEDLEAVTDTIIKPVLMDEGANQHSLINQNEIGEGQIVKVTAFSAQEYCAVPIIKQRFPNCNGNTFPESSIALNKKFGTQWTHIYIPKLNKQFKIIGTTDYKTDADIWFGANYQNAKEFGVQYLEINLLLK